MSAKSILVDGNALESFIALSSRLQTSAVPFLLEVMAAKRRGRRVGRPCLLTPSRLDHARGLIADGKEEAEVAALLDVGKATLRRALNARNMLARAGQADVV